MVYLKRLSVVQFLRTCTGVLALLLILPISPVILLILGLLKVSQGS